MVNLPSNDLIERIKKQAFKKEHGTYRQMLDKLSKELGFNSWHQVNELIKQKETFQEFQFTSFDMAVWEKHILPVYNNKIEPIVLMAFDIWDDHITNSKEFSDFFTVKPKETIILEGYLGDLAIKGYPVAKIYSDCFKQEHHKILKPGEVWAFPDIVEDDEFTTAKVTHIEDLLETFDVYYSGVYNRTFKEGFKPPHILHGTRSQINEVSFRT